MPTHNKCDLIEIGLHEILWKTRLTFLSYKVIAQGSGSKGLPLECQGYPLTKHFGTCYINGGPVYWEIPEIKRALWSYTLKP